VTASDFESDRSSLADRFRGPHGHSVLPGGFGRSSLAVGPWSPVAVRGEGHRVWDDRGRCLIDANNNFTTLVHGHAHPAIVDAVERAVRTGASFGLPTFSEARHAQALVERIPSVDQVRYANSGTEAVMTALRLARAHTGRDLVVVVRGAYHGTSDAVLVAGGPKGRRGVPRAVQQDTLLVAVDDVAALEAAVRAHADSVAAILLDLLPNRAGLHPVGDEYVAAVESLRRECGCVLIVDEVVSFRLAWGGLAAARGIEPDLITLGKAIGGGLPVGAVAGRAGIMAALDPFDPAAIEHGGTMTANPVTLDAGLAALELLDRAAVERINGLGDRARRALGEEIGPLGWEVRGQGSLLRPFPVGQPERERELQLQLWWQAIDRGLLLTSNGLVALSTAMDERVVDEVVERLAAALRAVVAA
jgi:glutamate-1-semialdehyde 2,1-aminomutase